VLAAMIEKETAVPASGPSGGGVHQPAARKMRLESDPTVIYA